MSDDIIVTIILHSVLELALVGVNMRQTIPTLENTGWHWRSLPRT